MSELVVTTDAAPEDLTTLASVRQFMQKGAGDIEQNELIAALITRASHAIMEEFEREFAPATASAARTFEYAGGAYLSLAPYDLRSVSGLQIDTDESSPTTLTTSEYRLFPYPTKNGTYLALRLEPYLAHSRARWQQRLVTVTGAWGFAEVPDDVEHWANVTVALWLRRDVASFESTFNLDEDRLERPSALPAAVKAGLSHYRRQSYA